MPSPTACGMVVENVLLFYLRVRPPGKLSLRGPLWRNYEPRYPRYKSPSCRPLSIFEAVTPPPLPVPEGRLKCTSTSSKRNLNSRTTGQHISKGLKQTQNAGPHREHRLVTTPPPTPPPQSPSNTRASCFYREGGSRWCLTFR